MHGLIFVLFIPVLLISIILNIIFLQMRKKHNISFKRNILFNMALFVFCVIISYIIYKSIMIFHDRIGCSEIENYESAIFLTLIFIPLGDILFLKPN